MLTAKQKEINNNTHTKKKPTTKQKNQNANQKTIKPKKLGKMKIML